MYKIGLLYCKNGQSLEEEMYNNGMFICMCVCTYNNHGNNTCNLQCVRYVITMVMYVVF